MRPPPISKPLFALLLFSGITSLLILLKPAANPGEGDRQAADNDLLPLRPPAARQPLSVQQWQRPDRPLAPYPAGETTRPVTPAVPPDRPEPDAADHRITAPLQPAPPFRYLGRLERDDRTWIFLEQGETSHAIALGDTFEGRWKIISLTADSLMVTHVPTGTPFRLPLEP